MSRTVQHEMVVVGGGPAGYVAAIRAAQLGLDVACIEREKALGGTCLRVGCIPSKALLESSALYYEARTKGLAGHGIKIEALSLDLGAMMKRKEKEVRALSTGIAGLFKKRKVVSYAGSARFVEPQRLVIEGEGETIDVQAKHVIIATGSKAASLTGVTIDGDRIGTSTEALEYGDIPPRLVVIGAGAIGLELGSVWSRLGSQVVVLEYLDRILPGIDAEIASEAQKILAKQGLDFRLGVRVTGARVVDNECVVSLADDQPEVRADRVLLAVGRVPNTDRLGLEAIGLETDGRGFIPVDDSYQTAIPHVYAIGDVIPGPMLAHKASEEGVACVERIVTGYGHVNYDAIPNVVYTDPEVASVGKTEGQLQRAGIDYKKGSFPFMALGRARALGHTEGRVKVLADAATDRLLGVHIVGARAGDLIAEAAVAIEFGASAEDLGRASHAHPTLAEAVKEAALAVDRKAIHI